jgi:thioredoxin-related protein
MFDANKTLAKNIRERLTSLVPGGKAPNFVLAQEGKETLTLIGLRGKHVYLNFVDLKSKENMKELNLLQELQKKYSKYVRIISVYKDDVDIPSEHLEEIKNYNWEIYGISGSNSMWNSYRVEAFPQYVFIDGAGYVIASPALSPVPNGEYETIDQSFFQLKKAWEIEHSDGGEFYDRNH